MQTIQLSSGKILGAGAPCYIIAEIGINHNGSLETAKKLIDAAVEAKVDAVKFQKRTPEICVPKDQWEIMRETPWGPMTYIDYKRKTEFGVLEYSEIDSYCKQKGIDWFASAWDEPSVDFMENFEPVMYKLASASLTDDALIRKICATGRPIMISTGMSRIDEITFAVELIREYGDYPLMIAHATSAYPCKPEELNLRMINTLQTLYPEYIIGYSGHETGLSTTVSSVAIGAQFIERHFTLDRAMWGSDHSASVEPQGFVRLVKDIRDTELALGDGIKVVYESEVGPMKKLRVNITTNRESEKV